MVIHDLGDLPDGYPWGRRPTHGYPSMTTHMDTRGYFNPKLEIPFVVDTRLSKGDMVGRLAVFRLHRRVQISAELSPKG